MEILFHHLIKGFGNDFVHYIAQDDYETAEQWVLELVSQTDKLAVHPSIGRVVPEYNEETLRELVGNYRLAYRIKEGWYLY